MVAEKRQTKDEQRMTNERTEWSEFVIRLVRIPTIGPNSERLVRIPNEWRVWRCDRVERADVVKFVKVLNAKKKLAWTDLDRVSFKKFVK